MLRLALASTGRSGTAINRSQALVIGFFAAVWFALATVLLVAPEIYVETLRPAGIPAAVAGIGFFIALTALMVALSFAVVRRSRWAFWLLLAAFLSGLLRIPASVLQLAGIAPATGPVWYELFQAVVGGVQFVIGVLLLRGYKRGGVWGRF
jgi:hypothetical protein